MSSDSRGSSKRGSKDLHAASSQVDQTTASSIADGYSLIYQSSTLSTNGQIRTDSPALNSESTPLNPAPVTATIVSSATAAAAFSFLFEWIYYIFSFTNLASKSSSRTSRKIAGRNGTGQVAMSDCVIAKGMPAPTSMHHRSPTFIHSIMSGHRAILFVSIMQKAKRGYYHPSVTDRANLIASFMPMMPRRLTEKAVRAERNPLLAVWNNKPCHCLTSLCLTRALIAYLRFSELSAQAFPIDFEMIYFENSFLLLCFS